MFRFAVVLFAVAAAFSADVAEAAPARELFRVTESPLFYRPRLALERFVAASHARSAKVCVIGYASADSTHAWVHWPERNALVLWEPGTKGTDNLMTSRRFLDLDRDVVATEDEVAGSTYLVTRAWVDRVVNDCQSRGERFSIRVSAQRVAPTSRHR